MWMSIDKESEREEKVEEVMEKSVVISSRTMEFKRI